MKTHIQKTNFKLLPQWKKETTRTPPTGSSSSARRPAVADELEAPAYALSVLPTEIPAQRAKGWPDFHPETFCHRCGRRSMNWWTDAEAWEAATANQPRKELEILCPPCFAALWEQETGERVAWEVRRG